MLTHGFFSAVAESSIYHACELIVKRKLRYLPVVNPMGTATLSVLTQIDILGR